MQSGGVDIIPTGGRGGDNPLKGVDPSLPRQIDDFIDFKNKQRECHKQCFSYQQTVDQICKTGPNYHAVDLCWRKSGRFYTRCMNACDKGDFDHDFQYSMPPAQRDFFPWLGREMEDL